MGDSKFAFDFSADQTQESVLQNVREKINARFADGGQNANVSGALAYARQNFFQNPSSRPRYIITFINELPEDQRTAVRNQAGQLRLNEILSMAVSYDGSTIDGNTLSYLVFNELPALTLSGVNFEYGDFDIIQTLQQASSIYQTATDGSVRPVVTPRDPSQDDLTTARPGQSSAYIY